jgi:hypothetical protein
MTGERLDADLGGRAVVTRAPDLQSADRDLVLHAMERELSIEGDRSRSGNSLNPWMPCLPRVRVRIAHSAINGVVSGAAGESHPPRGGRRRLELEQEADGG